MENKKIYDSLNKETQKFIKEVFSYIDYFTSKDVAITFVSSS